MSPSTKHSPSKQGAFASACYEFWSGFETAPKRKQRVVSSLAIWILCVGAAISVDEGWCHLPWLADQLTYPQKWELFALLASSVTAIVYWADMISLHSDIGTNHLRLGMVWWLLALVSLVGALVTLVWIPHPYTHWACVFVAAIAFALDDLSTWKGLIDNLNERCEKAKEEKRENEAFRLSLSAEQQAGFDKLPGSRPSVTMPEQELKEHISDAFYSLYAADTPMCLGMAVIIIYLVFHHWQHYHYHIWKAIDPATEDYFVGGCFAFQFLASSLMYILISTGVFEKAHRMTAEMSQGDTL